MATLFRQAGGGVTVVEKAAQILPNAVDPSVASALQRLMEKQGIKFEVGGSPQSPLKGGLEPPDEITISCIGREYCTEELQGADLVFGPRGEVVVDDQMMTNLPSVAAAGDITGKMMLAHVAYAQGKAAISALNGKPLTPIRYDLVPFCVFTSPPLASIGAMTGDCIQTIPLASVGVAQAKGATEGFLRVVVGKEGGVDGVQLIGSQAQELIATASILMRAKIPWAQWSEIIWAHPTLSEIFGGSH
jgi:dihydrolipoamide dehydrogenase